MYIINPMLRRSSFVFLLPLAIDTQKWVHVLACMQFTLSYMNYLLENTPAYAVINPIDRTFAHFFGIATLVQSFNVPRNDATRPSLMVYYACLAYCITEYHIIALSHFERWHLTTHIAANVGVLALCHAMGSRSLLL